MSTSSSSNKCKFAIKFAKGMKVREFELCEKLGGGQFAEVWKTTCGRALKLYREIDDERFYKNELRGWTRAGTHNSILPLYGTIVDLLAGEPFPQICLAMITEPMDTSLDRVIKSDIMSDREKWRVCERAADGLKYLHSRGIIHGDIKPSNILVRGDDIKLCDFGSARCGSPVLLKTVGTIAYSAPETLFRMDIYPGSDVWAFCAMLYEIHAGKSLFVLSDELCDYTCCDKPAIREMLSQIEQFAGLIPRQYVVKFPGYFARGRRVRGEMIAFSCANVPTDIIALIREGIRYKSRATMERIHALINARFQQVVL